MPPPAIALIRRLPRSYRAFYAAMSIDVDLELALRQHAAYQEALGEAGLDVETIPADEGFPDCVFIEDTAVVWHDRALRTCMAPHREGEQAGVSTRLKQNHEVVTLPAGATLDGGDVLHAGDTTYVGRSRRTNAAGAAALRSFLAPRRVVEVPVDRCLHLKSAATWLGDDTLLAAATLVDLARFDVPRVLLTAPGEEKAANTLRLGNHLLVLEGYPTTTARLCEFAAVHDITLRPLDMSEFEKGDGSLTCLSIIL